MSEAADARRLRLLEMIGGRDGGKELEQYAAAFHVDDRTIRRDVGYLQDLLASLRGLEVRQGRVNPIREGFATGHLAAELGQRSVAKEAIAGQVVAELEDDTPLVLTAGSTTYCVARALRRSYVEHSRPRNLIAYTNSLPSLVQLIAGGIKTGVIGEAYDQQDSAFHAHELGSTFSPSVAIVGASGAVAGPALELFSDQPAEAAFMKQLLAKVPQIVVAADSSKVGRRHPWRFTDEALLAGKAVRLVTDALNPEQRGSLEKLVQESPQLGIQFSYVEAGKSTGITEG